MGVVLVDDKDTRISAIDGLINDYSEKLSESNQVIMTGLYGDDGLYDYLKEKETEKKDLPSDKSLNSVLKVKKLVEREADAIKQANYTIANRLDDVDYYRKSINYLDTLKELIMSVESFDALILEYIPEEVDRLPRLKVKGSSPLINALLSFTLRQSDNSNYIDIDLAMFCEQDINKLIMSSDLISTPERTNQYLVDKLKQDIEVQGRQESTNGVGVNNFKNIMDNKKMSEALDVDEEVWKDAHRNLVGEILMINKWVRIIRQS